MGDDHDDKRKADHPAGAFDCGNGGNNHLLFSAGPGVWRGVAVDSGHVTGHG